MKRIISLLVVVIIVGSFCACGGNKSPVGTWRNIEPNYIPKYNCYVDSALEFSANGGFSRTIFDHETATLLDMEVGTWTVDGKEVRVDDGGVGTTIYHFRSDKLITGSQKFQKQGE